MHAPALLSDGGRVFPGMAHSVDVWPTLCFLAGLSECGDTGPGKVPIDGTNLWPALVAGSASPRTELLLGIGDPPNFNGCLRQSISAKDAAGRFGGTSASEMKLIVGIQHPSAWVGSHYPNKSTPTTRWPPAAACSPACLFKYVGVAPPFLQPRFATTAESLLTHPRLA